MPLMRPSVIVILLAFFILSAAPLLGAVHAGDQVITMDRLNLRACPGTSGCRVLRTLPLDTQLTVNDSRGEWLHVTVPAKEASGWVHASYTRVVESPASFSWPKFLERGFLARLFVAACFLGALLVPAYVGPRIKPNITGQQFFVLSAVSVLTGAIVLLNQFGPLLAELAPTDLKIYRLSFLWEVNSVVEGNLDYSKIVLLLAALGIGIAAVAPSANGCKISFLQGAGTGFLALPILAAAFLLAGIIGYIIVLIVKLVGFILGIIAIPLIWIWEHILSPVLRFLAIPFVWLWENFLRAIIEFISIPFMWLWRVALRPVTAFLTKFVLVPIVVLIAGVAAALIALLPFGVIGVVVIESVRSSVRGSLNNLGLFAQGVTLGFLLFDATLLAGLNAFGVLHTVPPVSLCIPAVLQIIVVLRLLAPREPAIGEVCPVFRDKLLSYWKSSRLELVSTCVLIPMALLASAMGEDS